MISPDWGTDIILFAREPIISPYFSTFMVGARHSMVKVPLFHGFEPTQALGKAMTFSDLEESFTGQSLAQIRTTSWNMATDQVHVAQNPTFHRTVL